MQTKPFQSLSQQQKFHSLGTSRVSREAEKWVLPHMRLAGAYVGTACFGVKLARLKMYHCLPFSGYAVTTLNTVGKTGSERANEKQVVTDSGRGHGEVQAEEQEGRPEKAAGPCRVVSEAVSELRTPERKLEP